MKRVVPQDNWPDSWKLSYQYDLLEVFGCEPKSAYSRAYARRRDQTLRLIDKFAYPGCKILDVAAAQGNFSLLLAERGYEVTWNDLRQELAGYVQLKQEYGHIEFAPGNAFDLAENHKFDLVLLTEMIEHVAHPDRLLMQMAQLVKPGGYIIMTTPNGEYFLNSLPRFSNCADPSIYESGQFAPDADGHIFLLHLDEVESLAKAAGLEIVELSLSTNLLTAGHLKTAGLLKLLPDGLIEAAEQLSNRLPLFLRRRLHFSLAVALKRIG